MKKFYAIAHKLEDGYYVKNTNADFTTSIDEALLVSDFETVEDLIQAYFCLDANFMVVPVELINYNDGVSTWSIEEPVEWQQFR